MNPLISVIVPVYNVEKYLPMCVGSLIKQTFSYLEIILVDDGSIDNSGAMCDRYASEDNRVRVIHKNNGGLSDARNVGIANAKGEYISFVDSDDWMDINAYKQIADAIYVNNPDIICFGRYSVFEHKTTENFRPFENKTISGKECLKELLENKQCDGTVCDKVFRKKLFENVEFPVGQLFEDLAICPSLIVKANCVSFINQSFYYYRKRSGSITHDNCTKKHFFLAEDGKNLVSLVENTYPEYLPMAYDFYAKTLIGVIILIDKSDKFVQHNYKKERAGFLQELKRYDKYIVNKKNRVKALILYFGLYRLFKKIPFL